MAEEIQRKSSTWVRVLLIGSIALNFVFVGLAGGAFLKASRSDAPISSIGRMGGPILSGFDQSQRSEFRREVLRNREGFRGLRRGVGEADAKIRDALTAEPFDPDAFEDALEGRRDAMALAVDAINERIVLIVNDMTDEERAAVAEIMGERVKRFKKDDPFNGRN